MNIFSFSFVHFQSSRPLGVSGTHKKLERTTHTLYIRLYSTVRPVMPDCRGVGESRIYSKRAEKVPLRDLSLNLTSQC